VSALQAGDIAVKLIGDSAGDIVYVAEVTSDEHGPWVKWSYHKPDPATVIRSGSRPECLRPASRTEVLFWELGINSPTQAQHDALADYREWWALR
jgi:hypothetical protein